MNSNKEHAFGRPSSYSRGGTKHALYRSNHFAYLDFYLEFIITQTFILHVYIHINSFLYSKNIL